MGYIVVLKQKGTGLVTDIPFDSAEEFESWFTANIKQTNEVVAAGVTESEAESIVQSKEAVSNALRLLTPEKQSPR